MFFSINNNVYLKTVHINVPIGLVRGPVGPGRSSTHDWPCTVLTKEYVKTIKMCWVFIIYVPFARMHVYWGGGRTKLPSGWKIIIPACGIAVFAYFGWGAEDRRRKTRSRLATILYTETRYTPPLPETGAR